MVAPSDQPASALTVDEAIACLRTAVATQAGLVKEVEGDDETGKRFCEVKIADERGSAINSRSMCRPIRWLRPSKRPTEPGRCA